MAIDPVTYHVLKADYDPSEWTVEPYTIVEAFTCMSDLQVRAEEIRLEVAGNNSLDGVELEVDVATKEELKELLDNYTYYSMFPEEHPDKIKQKEKEELDMLRSLHKGLKHELFCVQNLYRANVKMQTPYKEHEVRALNLLAEQESLLYHLLYKGEESK